MFREGSSPKPTRGSFEVDVVTNTGTDGRLVHAPDGTQRAAAARVMRHVKNFKHGPKEHVFRAFVWDWFSSGDPYLKDTEIQGLWFHCRGKTRDPLATTPLNTWGIYIYAAPRLFL